MIQLIFKNPSGCPEGVAYDAIEIEIIDGSWPPGYE